MSVSGRIGQTFHFVAVNDDPTGNVDPNAIDTWAEVDEDGALASTGVIGPVVGSGATADAPAMASGTTFVAATGTDPDGNAVTSTPYPVTVLTATDASVVTVTGSVS